MEWKNNEWCGDERWDDKKHAEVEALRAIAEQLEKLYKFAENHLSKCESRELWKVK